MIPPLELRHLRRQGWRFSYDPISGQIKPQKPAGATDEQVMEARRLIQSVREQVIWSLREDAAVDRLPDDLTSAQKAHVDFLAETDVDELERYVGALVSVGRAA